VKIEPNSHNATSLTEQQALSAVSALGDGATVM
jgi:hypothetical protein